MEKNKIWNSKVFKWSVILVIFIGVFFLREDSVSNLMSKFKELSINEMKLEYVSKVKLENPGKAEIYGDKILNWSENNLEIISKDGEVLDKKSFEIENPSILFGAEKIYIIDRDLGEIHSFYENGQRLGRLKIEKDLFHLKEEDGNLMCHIKSQEGEVLSIYNSIGEEIAREKDLENILTYSLDKDNSNYLISNMDLDNGMESNVSIYNLDGELKSRKVFPGEIILWTKFFQEKQLVLSNLKLYLLDGEDIKWERSFPFIKDIDIVHEKIYVLYDSNLEILNLDGKTEEKLVFPKNYNKILEYEGYGIIYGENDILGIRKGEEVFEYTIKDEIQEMYKTEDLLGVRVNDYIDLFKLKEKN